jgi:predicted nucleic-acid-binding Zn-ribbon protein
MIEFHCQGCRAKNYEERPVRVFKDVDLENGDTSDGGKYPYQPEHFIAEDDAKSCPTCGSENIIAVGDKRIQGFERLGEGALLNGKVIHSLHPLDPKRIVTSERQAIDVCRERGVNYETGEVADKQKYDSARKRFTEKNVALKNKGRKPKPIRPDNR